MTVAALFVAFTLKLTNHLIDLLTFLRFISVLVFGRRLLSLLLLKLLLFLFLPVPRHHHQLNWEAKDGLRFEPRETFESEFTAKKLHKLVGSCQAET